MKILLATYWHLPHVGGVSTYVGILRRRLEELGHEVEVLAHHPDFTRYHLMNEGKVIPKSPLWKKAEEIIKEEFQRAGIRLTPWLAAHETEKYAFSLACQQAGLDGYDLIHAQDIHAASACFRAKPRHIPLIATIHGCLAAEWTVTGEIRFRTPLEREYIALEEYSGAMAPDGLILPSRWLSRCLARFRIIHPRASVIPYGHNLKAFLPREKEEAVHSDKGRKILACPARLVAIKGQSCLLEALAILCKKRSDVVLWLIGDGAMREELENQARRLGLEDMVRFLGERSDMPALLAAADVIVLPSLQDNLPFAIMEAQALGKPVVASKTGGIEEMIDDGRNGLLVKPGDVEGLCGKILLLLEDEALREALGREAAQHARAMWDEDRMVFRTLEVYREAWQRMNAAGGDFPGTVVPSMVEMLRETCEDLSAETGDPEVYAELQGTVTSKGDGHPVPGAALHLLDVTGVVCKSAATDGAGQYAFSEVQPGNYSLMCSAGARGRIVKKISVPEGSGQLRFDIPF